MQLNLNKYIQKEIIILLLLITIRFEVDCQKPTDDFLISFIDNSSGEELYGYKNNKGDIIISPKFHFSYTDTMYDFAIVLLDDKWVGINREEKIIVEPYIFDNGPDYVAEGLFRFVKDNKIGFANLNGEIIIPATYDFVTPFQDGYALFNTGGAIEKSDSEHKEWVGGLWGFINKSGEVIINPQFLKAHNFENGKAEVVTQEGNRVFIDKEGKIVNE